MTASTCSPASSTTCSPRIPRTPSSSPPTADEFAALYRQLPPQSYGFSNT